MKCKGVDGVMTCNEECAPNSKYCAKHKRIAHLAFKQMIAEQQLERQSRDIRYREAYEAAHAAGVAAGESKVPVPMVVQEHAIPFDDSSPVVYREVVPQGICGFAWVDIKPANCKFANWLKKNEKGSYSSYDRSVKIWVSSFGQSYEKKVAYAGAFAEELFKRLEKGDIGEIRVGSRLD